MGQLACAHARARHEFAARRLTPVHGARLRLETFKLNGHSRASSLGLESSSCTVKSKRIFRSSRSGIISPFAIFSSVLQTEKTNRQIDKQTNRHIDIKTNRQTDRQSFDKNNESYKSRQLFPFLCKGLAESLPPQINRHSTEIEKI